MKVMMVSTELVAVKRMKNRKLSLSVYTLGFLGHCILNKQQKLIGEMTPFHLKYYFNYRLLVKSAKAGEAGASKWRKCKVGLGCDQ